MKPRAPRTASASPTGRSVALEVLLECQRGQRFVQEVLDQHLNQKRLSPSERRLATQLAYGVLRRRGTLDALLRPLIQRQPYQVEPWLWEILRLGAYQLVLLSHIPAHAALNETVELVSRFPRPKARGFVNAVLRALVPLVCEDRTTTPAADAVPFERGEYRRLTRPVLPEPGTDPVEYLASGFSVARWLAARWLQRYGWEECLRLGFWFVGPGPLWLRCNRLRTNRASFLTALAQANVVAEPGELPEAVRLADHVPIRELPGYREGWFTVQDEASIRAGAALAPAPGSQVLDLCAAPGGKTTHLAELMHNEGRLLACDVAEGRLETVAELCHRLGITIVETQRLCPERNEEPPAGPFDAILVDAPCSNSGVLGRRPEVRWRLRPVELQHLVRLQTKLLLQAAERIRPAGVIVYSTCSIEPEENREVVQNVLRAMPALVLEAEEQQIPGRPSDGGYWARLRYIGEHVF
jgi:16S rRNA (cytosine967-C5)-methyltransferase